MNRPMILVAAACMCITVGCGGDGGELVLKRRSNLHELGLAYRGFHDANGKAAVDAAELTDFMKSEASGSEQIQDAITSLEEVDIVMNWSGHLGDPSEDSKYVLGFEAGVPSTGGYVVMGDGTVSLMTAKDFAEATMLPSATE